ncbi:MAG: signal peptide peptidase SppA [Nitrospina sp.]|jgi:protease-4|nr:signal peptide peptidase SppA [Nitrospina sp.]MBT3508581.1 signal peptide peptidase SppA [Nitrospina sp.]MBT3875357.1 signal peptide peptidase SppA [Nitrospina sp.]MBT4048558.1 signal peptide peptidase SppA [Nitrospina sp.]MBT4558986.1 signal peptide peptidase SppA [Nitrospina sp.]
MENTISNKPQRSFFRSFFRFSAGLIILMVLVSIGSAFLPDRWKSPSGDIALIRIQGMLMDSQDIVRQLTDYRHNKQVRGILLRIDSPGGAVAPAQEIYNEIMKLRAENITVFASMGTVAASGGYYIACAADYVLANPGTLTGSISAVMAFNNIEELTKKVGVKPDVIKSGKYKDVGSPLRAMKPEERKLLQDVVDDVHLQFVQAVVKGRGLPISEVRLIADGRIMTGKQALELKLVDELGGLEKTKELLAKKIGVQGRPKVIEEKEKTPFFDWLLQGSIPSQLAASLIPSFGPTLQYVWNPL